MNCKESYSISGIVKGWCWYLRLPRLDVFPGHACNISDYPAFFTRPVNVPPYRLVNLPETTSNSASASYTTPLQKPTSKPFQPLLPLIQNLGQLILIEALEHTLLLRLPPQLPQPNSSAPTIRPNNKTSSITKHLIPQSSL